MVQIQTPWRRGFTECHVCCRRDRTLSGGVDKISVDMGGLLLRIGLCRTAVQLLRKLSHTQ